MRIEKVSPTIVRGAHRLEAGAARRGEGGRRRCAWRAGCRPCEEVVEDPTSSVTVAPAWASTEANSTGSPAIEAVWPITPAWPASLRPDGHDLLAGEHRAPHRAREGQAVEVAEAFDVDADAVDVWRAANQDSRSPWVRSVWLSIAIM